MTAVNDLIYMDSAATTPLNPKALDAMLPYLTGSFGNPSAAYGLARAAQKALDDARVNVARVLSCRTSDVMFTSGGTESINAAIRGVAFAQMKARAGNHVITTAIEHHAVVGPTRDAPCHDRLTSRSLGFTVHDATAGKDFRGPRLDVLPDDVAMSASRCG